MIWLFLAAVVTAATSPPAQGRPAGPPPVSAECRQAMDENWAKALKAFHGKLIDDAEALVGKAQAACSADAGLHPLFATFTADIDLVRGKPRDAVTALDSAPLNETSGLWPHSRFIYLSAFKALGNKARFRAERDRLVAVNEARMLATDYWMKQERFETRAAFVDAYRRRAHKGDPNDTLFIATPKAAEMPVSYQQNEGGFGGLMSALTGKADDRDEIGDLNQCTMHASLTPTKATYKAWRAKAVTLFSDPKTFAGDAGAGSNFCPGWGFIFPALVPPDEEK